MEKVGGLGKRKAREELFEAQKEGVRKEIGEGRADLKMSSLFSLRFASLLICFGQSL